MPTPHEVHVAGGFGPPQPAFHQLPVQVPTLATVPPVMA
jgi:hypothetical protein